MISIIIPTYNSERTIKRCLDSIVEQTFADWEVLLMDGGSKDRTLEIARSYNDSRIRIYSEPDKGIYDAMNKGIIKSKGEWLYFLGSDDCLCDAQVLEKVSKELTEKYKIVYGDVEASQLLPENLGEWHATMIDYNRCHQAIFYHRSVFKKYGLYDLSYPLYADYMYNIKCFWYYRVPTKYIPVVIAHFAEGGASSSGNDPLFYRDFSLIKFRYGRKGRTINQRKELAWEVMRNTDSRRIRWAMRMYVYYLRLIAKLQKLNGNW